MGEHPNVKRARRALVAFARGDLSTIDDLLDDDVVWHQPGDNSISGVYRGREAILELFVRMWKETEGTFRSQAYDIVADDDHVVALVRTTAERKGRHLDQRFVQVFHVSPEGRLVERWLLAEDLDAVNAFWA